MFYLFYYLFPMGYWFIYTEYGIQKMMTLGLFKDLWNPPKKTEIYKYLTCLNFWDVPW